MTKALNRARRALILGAVLLPLLPGLSFAQGQLS